MMPMLMNLSSKPNFEQVEKDEQGVPIPPKVLRIHESGLQEFLEVGQTRTTKMLEILEQENCSLPETAKILEFGCSSGRLIRHLEKYTKSGEVWGVDIAADHILWCQDYLNPAFNFLTVTSAPHLPIEDNYFDFIYAGSVFTHIDDLADAWFLELRRVTKKGGRLYITINDNKSLQKVEEKAEKGTRNYAILNTKSYQQFRESQGNMLVIGRSLNSVIYYDRDYLVKKLNKYFNIKAIVEEAFTRQTAYLLEK